MSVLALTAAGAALAACGSDSTPNPSSPETSVVDARQAPGPGGNNPGGDTNPTKETATTRASVTGDTQEKIDDQSPSGGGGLTGDTSTP